MLGIVIAGNIAMVFVFWELVGICSYFLIGFYIERQKRLDRGQQGVHRQSRRRLRHDHRADGTLWASLGTFAFGDQRQRRQRQIDASERGIFSQVRQPANDYHLATPDGMVRAAAADQIAARRAIRRAEQIEPSGATTSARMAIGRKTPIGCWSWPGWEFSAAAWARVRSFRCTSGCPTRWKARRPSAALVHSATMVAAGVYLVGRFYPVFVPEVLLVIAIIGCITLFIAATIAITATDIKRVLAYSTVSQLGYMMLALGVGGWVAGMFHLITHAFFKSLLFMCSGSVIHACHTNEMTQMGGLRKKMPWTAYTMLAGCLAIIGAGMPFSIGLSGHYSKDAILAQALSFKASNPTVRLAVLRGRRRRGDHRVLHVPSVVS